METEKKWYKIQLAELRSLRFFPLNSLRKVIINDRSICLARTTRGIIAFDDRCPHAGYPLSEGWCNDKSIICPLHNLKFDIHTGQSIFNEGYRLRMHPVNENENGIFIQL